MSHTLATSPRDLRCCFSLFLSMYCVDGAFTSPKNMLHPPEDVMILRNKHQVILTLKRSYTYPKLWDYKSVLLEYLNIFIILEDDPCFVVYLLAFA